MYKSPEPPDDAAILESQTMSYYFTQVTLQVVSF